MKNLNEITLNGIMNEVGTELFIKRLSYIVDNSDLNCLLNGKILSIIAFDAAAVARMIINIYPQRKMSNVKVIEVTPYNKESDKVYVRYTYTSEGDSIVKHDSDPIDVTDDLAIIFEQV